MSPELVVSICTLILVVVFGCLNFWKTSNVKVAVEQREIFKPILGYEGIYAISNWGRVVSLKTGCEVKSHPNKSRGYYQVMLWKNGKAKFYYVQRLVALAFIENPKNWRYVKHFDIDKSNNRADNLYWAPKMHYN